MIFRRPTIENFIPLASHPPAFTIHRVSWEGSNSHPPGKADCGNATDAATVCAGLLKLGLAAVVWEVASDALREVG